MDAAKLNPLIDIGISPRFVERFRIGRSTFNTDALLTALKKTVTAQRLHVHPDYKPKPTKEQTDEGKRLSQVVSGLKPDQLETHIKDLFQRSPVAQNLQRVMVFATQLSQRLEKSKNNFAAMMTNIFTGDHALTKVNAKPARICIQTNPQVTEEQLGQPANYDQTRQVFFHRDPYNSKLEISLDFKDIAIDTKGKVTATKLKAPKTQGRQSNRAAMPGLKIPKGKPKQGTWTLADEYETLGGAEGKLSLNTEGRAQTLPIRVVGCVDLEAFYHKNQDDEPICGHLEFDASTSEGQDSKFKFPYYSSFNLTSSPNMLDNFSTDIKEGNYLVAVRDDVDAKSTEAQEFFVLGKIKGYHATA